LQHLSDFPGDFLKDLSLTGILSGVDDQRPQFEELFRAHWPKVVALGFRLSRDPAEAADIAQETFIAVHRGLDGYRGSGSITAWILKIALHVGLKERTRRRRRAGAGEAGLENLPAREEREGGELSERIAKALAALPDDQRSVLSLYAIDGLTHAEIAEVLGVPEGTVWSRLHHARKKLRLRLGGSES
jgi:RNA polymerase sigma-70 factor (ECF subfamily)